jgi:hypothetical protein
MTLDACCILTGEKYAWTGTPVGRVEDSRVAGQLLRNISLNIITSQQCFSHKEAVSAIA